MHVLHDCWCNQVYVVALDDGPVLIDLGHVLVGHIGRQAREYVSTVLRLAPAEFLVSDVVTAHDGSDVIVVIGEPEEEQTDERD